MRRLSLAAALLLATAAPAAAQVVPDEAVRDLWCGLAFEIISRDVPPDASEVQLQIVDRYRDGARTLVDRALVAHLAAGYSEPALEVHRADMVAEIEGQMAATPGEGSAEPLPYSFEECAKLVTQ
jgi:hypothetical protein